MRKIRRGTPAPRCGRAADPTLGRYAAGLRASGGGTTRGVWGRNTAKRQQGIYAIDKVKKIRASYENPEVIRLYQEYLGSPGSERAHELLHCEYKPWKKRERKLTGPEILESVELSPE